MLKNYFKIALRGFQRRKLFTAINVVGLTIGLTLVGLIGIYAYESYMVDQDQPQRLYRITTAYESETTKDELPAVGRALIPRIGMDVPEVETLVPLYKVPLPVKVENEYFFDQIAFAGSAFLTSFHFETLNGAPQNALDGPNKVVLTASAAHKYFATTDVIGQTLSLGDTTLLTVSAVIQDMAHSHIDVDVLVSFDTWIAMGGDMDEWFVWDMTCYALLKPDADPEIATQKIAALSMAHNGEQYRQHGYEVSHRLEAVQDIYLKSTLQGFNRSSGSLQQLYILMAIGAALLMLACINFINLTTALQLERSKEVGVRKTLGAPIGRLRLQFMVETGSLVLMATLIAYGFILLLLPIARNLTGLAMDFFSLFQTPMIFGTIGIMMITTLLAGLYPATLLSSLHPISAIKQTDLRNPKGIHVRQGLVVFQFATTLILVACTYICILQIRHMDSQDIGFQTAQVVVIDLSKTPFREFISNYEGIKHDLQQIAGIETVSGSAGLPGRSGWSGQVVKPEGFPQDKSFTMEVIPSDMDYTTALQIPIIAGRALQSDIPTDITEGVLLNEAACRQIGWTPAEAIGKRLTTSGMEQGKVVGVMADYHQHGLRQAINPIMVFNATYAFNYIALSVNSHSSDLQQVVNEAERVWKSRFPGYPFESFMLEDDFNAQYQQERIMASVIGVFALLTIVVACLGLIGLTTYTIVQKRKEIGIRKVLGASVSGIVMLLSQDFVKLVCFAIVIASPIAWWAMNNWLEDFAYRIDIQWWMFAVAGSVAVVIALLTVSWQAIRAAVANPVDSLRDE